MKGIMGEASGQAAHVADAGTRVRRRTPACCPHQHLLLSQPRPTWKPQARLPLLRQPTSPLPAELWPRCLALPLPH